MNFKQTNKIGSSFASFENSETHCFLNILQFNFCDFDDRSLISYNLKHLSIFKAVLKYLKSRKNFLAWHSEKTIFLKYLDISEVFAGWNLAGLYQF